MAAIGAARVGRGRRPDPRKRDAIVEAARRLFLEQGYGTSMDAIAEAAGVSKQTIYNAFANKEELFAEIVGRSSANIAEPLADRPGDPRTLAEVLTEFAWHLFAVIFSPQALAVYRLLLTERTQFPDLARTFYRVGPGTTHARLASYLARQAERGRLAVGEPEIAAEHFLGMLIGHNQMRRLLGVEEAPPTAQQERRIAAAVAAFLRAYAP